MKTALLSPFLAFGVSFGETFARSPSVTIVSPCPPASLCSLATPADAALLANLARDPSFRPSVAAVAPSLVAFVTRTLPRVAALASAPAEGAGSGSAGGGAGSSGAAGNGGGGTARSSGDESDTEESARPPRAASAREEVEPGGRRGPDGERAEVGVCESVREAGTEETVMWGE